MSPPPLAGGLEDFCLLSTMIFPGNWGPVLQLLDLDCLSAPEGGRFSQARGEVGVLPGEDLLRSAPIPWSGVEALSEPGLTVVQQYPSCRKAALAGRMTRGVELKAPSMERLMRLIARWYSTSTPFYHLQVNSAT